MFAPSFEQFTEYAALHPVVPVFVSYNEDLLTPIGIILKLAKFQPVYLLESVEGDEHLARYSIIGLGCRRLISDHDCSLEQLDHYLAQLTGPVLRQLPPFYGGLVGYFSYDINSFQLLEAELVVVHDHLLQQLTLIYNVHRQDTQGDTQQAYQQAQAKLGEVLTALRQPSTYQGLEYPNLAPQPLVFTSNTSKTRFEQMVERAKAYISEGDIFQVVLSQKFTAQGSVDSLALYRRLRQANPSPYMFYLKFPQLTLVGSSPEMLVKTEGQQVETVPIAGTRPVRNDGRDSLRAKELLADPKERAEHLMLLDLGRNDLGKISLPGTVKVKAYCQIKHFSRVMHLVSRVAGRLRPGLAALAPLRATFPAGTVSGAPKRRAMELIAELEPEGRGIYAGAVAYLSYTGNINSCIAIRTFVVDEAQKTVSVQAGAGIVADSKPEAEYQETLNKARALFMAATEGVEPYVVND